MVILLICSGDSSCWCELAKSSWEQE